MQCGVVTFEGSSTGPAPRASRRWTTLTSSRRSAPSPSICPPTTSRGASGPSITHTARSTEVNDSISRACFRSAQQELSRIARRAEFFNAVVSETDLQETYWLAWRRLAPALSGAMCSVRSSRLFRQRVERTIIWHVCAFACKADSSCTHGGRAVQRREWSPVRRLLLLSSSVLNLCQKAILEALPAACLASGHTASNCTLT